MNSFALIVGIEAGVVLSIALIALIALWLWRRGRRFGAWMLWMLALYAAILVPETVLVNRIVSELFGELFLWPLSIIRQTILVVFGVSAAFALFKRYQFPRASDSLATLYTQTQAV